MKASMESTDKIIEVDGVEARIWNGVTEKGVHFTALICRLGVKRGDDCADLEKEFRETQVPVPINRAFDPRML
jgi:hypothetical protein